MKKFSLMIVAALVAVAAWSSTASAQCGGRFFGHRGGGCGVFHGGGFCGPSYSCGPTYYYPSCNSGYVIQSQPDYTGGKKVMPSPSYQPYQGTPTPKTIDSDPPLPPKKIPAPNPKQDGPPTVQILYINGYAHGRLPDGSYAMIADGTYARLSGYGSK